jgi:hypothetical protein
MTIPQVKRQVEPELKPSMNESSISAFSVKFIPAYFNMQENSGHLKRNVAA